MPNCLHPYKIYKVGLLLILCTFLSNKTVYSQLDREFWFVAPPITKSHSAENSCNCDGGSRCGAAPVSLNIANFDTVFTTVSIEMPANSYDAVSNPTGFKDSVINIPPNTTERLVLWKNNVCDAPHYGMRKLVENRPHPTNPKTILQKGLHITATNFVTVYYEVEERNNSDVFALKGANALGDKFFAPFQTNKENGDRSPQQAFSSINIVATDPGTTNVWVYPTNEVLGWGQPDSFMISLKQGETYCIVPGVDNGGGNYTYNRAPGKRLNGTYIRTENGKRIAVTISDDSVRGDSGCQDLLGDQLIPVEVVYDDATRDSLIGREYIVMKGDLSNSNNDRIYIVATQNNTSVTVEDITNGTDTTYNIATLGTQQTHLIATNGDITYVDADKPVYVLHVTGGGGGCEIGEAILPTISQCTGSFNVGFSRGDGDDGTKDFLLNIMVQEINPGDPDSVRYAFTLNGIPGLIDGDDFIAIPGTPWWAAQFQADTISTGSSNILSNSKNIFHLGTLNGGSSNGGNYGYFSNYSKIEARSYVSGIGQPGVKMCFAETAQLVADGGLTYEWIPSTYLSDSTAQKPYTTPLANIKYSVVVKGASCSVPDTAIIEVLVSDSVSALFDVDKKFGCSPLEINFTNQSFGNEKNFWYNDDVLFSLKKAPPSLILTNYTDSAVDHEIKLITQNNFCFKTWTVIVRVYPEITAGFDQDKVEGCHPLEVHFTDTSSGNTHADGYFWDFGDASSSDSANPVNIFQNIGANDTTYTVQLVTTSPFLCTDSAEVDILVHPVVKASVAIDTSFSCSPMNIDFDPTGSINADSLFYSFSSTSFIDSVHFETNKTPLRFYHNDATQNAPDTVFINFWVRNDEGCYDTIDSIRQLIIFPEVHALFDVDTNEICDSLPIEFTNNSTGFNLASEWDFGNGNSKYDVSKSNYTEVYRNRGVIDSAYIVTLTVTSDYNSTCTDIMQDTITVHPFIRSIFTMDYSDNCSPVDATLYNVSQGATNYEWDFGDGTAISNTSAPSFGHQFENPLPALPDTFNIRLVATKNTCSDTSYRKIILTPQVVAQFAPDTKQGCQPLEITFSNTSTGAANYNWEFGDSTSYSVNNNNPFSHSFSNTTGNDRNFIVTLTATNNAGCDSIITDTIEVYSYVKADYTLDDAMECSPFTLSISNNSLFPSTLTYDWDFDNGDSDVATTPTYTYINQTNAFQEFTLKLTAENDDGCQDSIKRTVTVYPEVVASFKTSDSIFTNCSPFPVSFVNKSNVPAAFYLWDFDSDGAFSAATNPIFEFTNKGDIDSVYNVNLYAESVWGCYHDTTINISVYPEVTAKFLVANADSCSPFDIRIDNKSSIGSSSWDWSFGDGNSSTDENPTHIYTNTDILTRYDTLRLIAANGHSTCNDTFSRVITVYPEIDAGFTPDKLNGCEPLSVNFTNTTNIKINTDFTWNFDKNGAFSSAVDPSFEFPNTGASDSIYNVTLYAESEHGCTDNTTLGITTYAKVVANFVLDNSEQCSPFAIGIHNLPSVGTKNFEWSFSDTSLVSNDSIPLFTYINQGSVLKKDSVKLLAWNDHPECAKTFKRVITIYPEVDVDFATPDNIYENCEPFAVNLVNSTNIKTGTRFEWNFDDGTFSTAETPATHVYHHLETVTVNKNVKLKAESQHGCLDSTTKTIKIYPHILARFTIDKPDACSNELFEIDRTASKGNISSYSWDYDGGAPNDNESSSLFERSIVNSSTSPSNKEITLTVFNAQGCDTSWTEDIEIYPNINANFAFDDSSVCYPYTTILTNNSTIGVAKKYFWDFGDKSSSTEKSPTHKFNNFSKTADSVYTVKLIAESDYECADSITKDITIHPKPIANFSAPVSVNCPPFTTTFTNLSEIKNPTYHWDFKNGNTSNITSPTATFENNPSNKNIKEYNVELISETEFGCSDTVSKTISVYPQVNADFDSYTTDAFATLSNKGCNPLRLYFKGDTTNADEVEWDFDDNKNSVIIYPSNRFTNYKEVNDTFNVKLRAISKYNCSDSTIKKIVVYPNPLAEFDPDPIQQPFNTNTDITNVTFRNLTQHQSNWEYKWNFGDGTTSENKNVSFVKEYTIWGDATDNNKLTVTLTAWNKNQTECMHTKSFDIFIDPPKPEIKLESTATGCEPFTVDFSAAVKYDNGSNYKWEFGYNGESSTQKAPSFTYDTSGVYTAKLFVNGDGGTQWAYKVVTVNPTPRINFIFRPDTVMLLDENDGVQKEIISEPVQFYNLTLDANRYLWDFGDGTTSTAAEPSHRYNALGKYYITLNATSENDCESSFTHETPVTIDAKGILDYPNAFVPSQFGPTGGEYNPDDLSLQVFRPVSEGVIEYHLEIYTRWGELIFSSSSLTKGWDGYIDGKIAKQGVYIWRVKGKYSNGRPFTKAGDVTLLSVPGF